MSLKLNTKLVELIKKKLNMQIKVLHLLLRDDSYLHATHNKQAMSGNTHFFLQIISDDFINLTLLQRHQKINIILRQEYNELHSLKIEALTKTEYEYKISK